MQCVRFSLMPPQDLICIRRNTHSPEFQPIADMPQVTKMVDDGLHWIVSKIHFENCSHEDSQTLLKSLGLENPVPRNWSGNHRRYATYGEFLKDLARYRNKQRIFLKQSKTQLQMEEVMEGDFLSSAVLAPSSQQKLTKKLNNMKEKVANLDEKELNLLKQMICPSNTKTDEKRKEKKYVVKELKKRDHTIGDNEVEDAARTIQKAYRTYSRQKIRGRKPTTYVRDLDHKLKTKSDPSIPSTLLRSSTKPPHSINDRKLPKSNKKNSVFIFGGTNPFQKEDNTNPSRLIFQYVVNDNTWRKCGELPTPLHFHATAYLFGKIYLAGGKDPSKIINQDEAVSRKLWRYSPESKQWVRLQDMIHARRNFGLVVCNKKLFAIGGKDNHDRLLASVEKYDIDSDTWTEMRPLHTARSGLAAAELKGRIWVAGGLVSENVATNTVEYYNYHQNIWVQSESLQYGLCFSVMVPVREQLYLVGGAIGLQDSEIHGSGKQIALWDPAKHNWTLANMLIKPRHAHAAVYLHAEKEEEGHLFVLGGMSSKHSCVMDSVECWQEKEDLWFTGVAPIPNAVTGLSALAIPSNTFD